MVDLKLVGLFSVLMRPRAIAITTATASLVVLLIAQWINLWQLWCLPMTRALLMMVWGWTLIWSGVGRLDLLLRGVFHGLVGAAGLVMLALGVLLLIEQPNRTASAGRPSPVHRWLTILVLPGRLQ